MSASHLLDLRISADEWRFVDLRIDIPPKSFGSDAINPHTQYSNPVALLGDDGAGASFTLGAGNEMICAAAQFIVEQFDGATVGELAMDGIHEALTNPRQLRWISPNAGVPLMAAGLVMNTLLDRAAKSAGQPAWAFVATLPTEVLLSLIDLGPLAEDGLREQTASVLDDGLHGVRERCDALVADGLPVYFTTWIGHTPESIAAQMIEQEAGRGITRFKLKIGPDMDHDLTRLSRVRELVPDHFDLCVDANQTLSLVGARRWLDALSDLGFTWLEEPFAPDHVEAFRLLCDYRRWHGLTTEVVTGENCPNVHTASALMGAGIDRFQTDPCRMFGLMDTVTTSVLAKLAGCPVTPHAGGSGLDELSPHAQLINLARITGTPAATSLTENVGFCSHFFAAPTTVAGGRATAQTEPGLLVGLADDLGDRLIDYREGVTWLGL